MAASRRFRDAQLGEALRKAERALSDAAADAELGTTNE